MEIQKRENDLVIATFGRGFYILDDYTPLRGVSPETLEQEAAIFPIKDALMFVESSPLGYRGKGFQGESFFTTPNPPVGAVFTYFLKESPTTLKSERLKAQQKIAKEGGDVAWPSLEELRKEEEQEKAHLLFTVYDKEGNVVRRITQPARAGMHRVVWDFHYPAVSPVRLSQRSGAYSPYTSEPKGHRVAPGEYAVDMQISIDGELKTLVEKQPFMVKPLENLTLPPRDREAVEAFAEKAFALTRAIQSASRLSRELDNKLKHMAVAVKATPSAPLSLSKDIKGLQDELDQIKIDLTGDPLPGKYNMPSPPSISSRASTATYGVAGTTMEPTETMKEQYKIASEGFEPILEDLKKLVKDIQEVEKQLENYGAPYTPGRIPNWEKE